MPNIIEGIPYEKGKKMLGILKTGETPIYHFGKALENKIFI
jgi:hypothetical protein